MGDGSTYECANCGEASGAHGHYNFNTDAFTCKSKWAVPPSRNALGEMTLARQVDYPILSKDGVQGALNARGLSWAAVKEIRSDLVALECRYHDVTFEDLQKVSELFGTAKINLDNEIREGGYCETCRYSYSITVLTIMQVRRNPADG